MKVKAESEMLFRLRRVLHLIHRDEKTPTKKAKRKQRTMETPPATMMNEATERIRLQPKRAEALAIDPPQQMLTMIT